jgi:hypothetical protein
MKYIRLFENFDSIDLEQDCLDILREAEDDGYEVRFKINTDYIDLFIYKMGVFDFDEFWNGIKEVSERLESYLMDNGFVIENENWWQSPTKEKAEKRPMVQISRIVNTMKTQCRLLYKKKSIE